MTNTDQPRILSGHGRAYIVQRGDTLSQIGERVGIAWRRLAAHNRIRNPDIIHVGQFILLPE